jgi:hypothetical protein
MSRHPLTPIRLISGRGVPELVFRFVCSVQQDKLCAHGVHCESASR